LFSFVVLISIAYILTHGGVIVISVLFCLVVSAFCRLQVSIDESITTRIQSTHDAGNSKPRLILQAKRFTSSFMAQPQHFAEETAEILRYTSSRLIMTCCYGPVYHFISSNKRQIIYQKLLIQWRHVQQVLTEGTMTPDWHIVAPLLYSVRK